MQQHQGGNQRFSRGGGRNRGRGRGPGRSRGPPGGPGGPQPVKQLCNFFARGNCTNGDSCRFSHDIAVVSNLSNPGPIRSIAVTQDGWIFVASDKSIMAYNSTSGTIQLADSFSLDADIHHIEVVGQFLIVAVDGFVDQFPQVSVGQVNVLNLTTNQTIPLLRSEALPYTHPQSVRKFIAEPMDQDIYIITSGLEGMIHMWRFNTVSSLAEHVCAFEGHVREVTSILLKGNHIWSGSVDCTINIWDVTTRAVVHTIKTEDENFDSATSSGHSTAITCMTKITAPNGEFVATASLDGVLMIWDAEAKKTYECTEQATVTTMNVAMDSFGELILMLGLTSGFVVIRRWSNLDQFLLLDKQGLKHNGSVWAIVPCTAGVVATGGEDGLLNIWRTDKKLFP